MLLRDHGSNNGRRSWVHRFSVMATTSLVAREPVADRRTVTRSADPFIATQSTRRKRHSSPSWHRRRAGKNQACIAFVERSFVPQHCRRGGGLATCWSATVPGCNRQPQCSFSDAVDKPRFRDFGELRLQRRTTRACAASARTPCEAIWLLSLCEANTALDARDWFFVGCQNSNPGICTLASNSTGMPT